MEFFKNQSTVDFLKFRRTAVIGSTIAVVLSILATVYPGLNLGVDFSGGTELELQFKGAISASDVRNAIESLGHARPEVVAATGHENRYIIRVAEVATLEEAQLKTLRAKLDADLGAGKIEDVRASGGGDKVTITGTEALDDEKLKAAAGALGRPVVSVSPIGQSEEHRYQLLFAGVGDAIVDGLRSALGERAPESAMRVEWVGPKAGKQLRDAAVQAMLYTLALIMVYVALRFDLRFAPGGVIALFHDAIVVVGAYVLFQKEFTLGTVAAILTVIGYSINDTVVIYDRIRENMHRMRDAKLGEVINVSVTQTMSRTIITSSVTMLSILGFFIWGTPVVQDIAFALAVGFLSGVYSTVFIAAPVTEWIDRRFFAAPAAAR